MHDIGVWRSSSYLCVKQNWEKNPPANSGFDDQHDEVEGGA